ncbi:MAG: polysaccharide export protein [Deltaproteobacteria bacterium]|nr:polysaccharide export protein [Deltaproteobacteria bacterium]
MRTEIVRASAHVKRVLVRPILVWVVLASTHALCCVLLESCASSLPPVAQDGLIKVPNPPPARDTGPLLLPDASFTEQPLVQGDLVRLRVYQQPDLDLDSRIRADGTISVPLIGSIQAAGQTIPGLEETIRSRLAADFLRDPHVAVSVVEYARRKLYVLGAVQRPGGHQVSPSERLTLLQLVSAAGGLTEHATKEDVLIVRRTPTGERSVSRVSLVSVESALAHGDGGADPELGPEDLVIVGSKTRVVYVLGAVGSPGAVELPSGVPLTVSMAISKAGSFSKFAATGSIQVLRQSPEGPAKIGVDLDAVVAGDLSRDVAVESGDVIWVPERGLF